MGDNFLLSILYGGRGSPELWTSGHRVTRLQGVSLVLHCMALAVLLHFSVKQTQGNGPSVPGEELVRRLIFPGKWDGKLEPRGGGDGGERNPIPPTRGSAAPFGWIQFTPPSPRNESEAQLLAEPNLLGPPEMQPPQIQAEIWGSPLLKELTGSAGPGERGGTGTGCCGGAGPGGTGGGLGPGNEWGMGGPGPPRAGTRGTTYPACVYCPNPGYTEEARKAKYQGSVVLRAIITVDGRATNIRVIKGAGLGLDEKAIETVRTWKFKPALGLNRQPVETWQDIEINFRIY